MFVFAPLANITPGASHFTDFLLVMGARIPARVLGSIFGVRLILHTFPKIGYGPRLKVDIHRVALTEGCLTFAIVIISLSLSGNTLEVSSGRHGFQVSLSSLHILGSDLTGGCMNPASVMGWAYARGDHITKEHILVYCLAPVKATLLAVWTFIWVVKLLVEEKERKAKSE